MKTLIMSTQKNHLSKMVLLSAHNVQYNLSKNRHSHKDQKLVFKTN